MKNTVIYISCLGHSGSTILQYLLASHMNILGAGEIYQIAQTEIFHNNSYICSCGYTVDLCPLWHNFYITKYNTEIEFYKQLIKFLEDEYPHINYLVDTSKSIQGLSPWVNLIKESLISEIKILFLVRDVRGWVLSEKSRRLRKKISPRPLFLSCFDWKRRQKRILKSLQNFGLNFLIVSYESLIFNTQFALSRIAKFINLPLESNTYEINLSNAIVHDVFGNRMKNDFFKRSMITYDDSWQYHLGINLLIPVLCPIWRYNVYLRKLGEL